MNCPEKNEMDKKIKQVRKKAEDILNKGVIGRGSSKLQTTLESHQRIKILLDELDYTLQKDIPVEEVLKKISSVEKEIDLIRNRDEKER